MPLAVPLQIYCLEISLKLPEVVNCALSGQRRTRLYRDLTLTLRLRRALIFRDPDLSQMSWKEAKACFLGTYSTYSTIISNHEAETCHFWYQAAAKTSPLSHSHFLFCSSEAPGSGFCPATAGLPDAALPQRYPWTSTEGTAQNHWELRRLHWRWWTAGKNLLERIVK